MWFTVIEQIKKYVALHRLLVFKDQGIISGQRHVEISSWFGELESTFYKHPKSPPPDVFRVSNDPNEGCTGIVMSRLYVIGNKMSKSKGFKVLSGPCGVTGLVELAASTFMK